MSGFDLVALVVKDPPGSAGEMGLIPGSGRSPGVGNGINKPLSVLAWKNLMDRGT